ncbi:glycoprotein integral membrane protein 1 isoform X3 [Tachysurus vachellii]|uniref:glycoprotein integral membrane protein 1 isoform X3 n=1 Tax=Tachysurus vachellii TaxID=175792 RepID=UPI00296B04D4|nr:glycoprotein integral membrane protein 1 isoform X3 [Tachysurus vachellii]
MASYCAIFVLMISSLLVCALTETRQFGTENVINVTAVSENEESTYNVQISLNVTLVDNKTTVNGVPLKPSEVMRMPCQALLLDDSNVSLSDGAGTLISSVLRLMLDHSYLQSEAGDEVLLLTLGQEMIQLGEEQVWQPDVWEVKMLLNQTSEEVTQEQNIYPARSSKIAAMPRENDIIMTEEYIAKTGVVEDQVLHTTSHYPLRQAETTQEETAAPGKLPETPLRMEPGVLYEDAPQEKVNPDDLLPDVPLRQPHSSYNVVCRWVEELRDKLRRFCSESLPLFFLIMWVVVVGVVGSAVIIKILDLLFPTCEHKGLFHLNPETLMPEEKQSLIENVELEVEEQEKNQVNGELY